LNEEPNEKYEDEPHFHRLRSHGGNPVPMR
jgi:hypothetical protein